MARVVDGDTLHVEAEGRVYKVRLIGVDTPEAYPSPRLDREVERTGQDRQLLMALGRRASAFTRQLCQDKPCRLEYDQANSATGHRDRYKRLLAFVFVPGDGGQEVLVNAEIIRQGYGRAMTGYAFDDARRAEFIRLEQQARSAGRGLWGEWTP